MNKVAFITGASRASLETTATGVCRRAGYDLIISARTLGTASNHAIRRLADGSARPAAAASTAAEIRTLGRRVREIRLDLLDDSSGAVRRRRGSCAPSAGSTCW